MGNAAFATCTVVPGISFIPVSRNINHYFKRSWTLPTGSEEGETQGFVKVIAKDNKLVGACIIASQGAEMIHGYIDLMTANAPYEILDKAVHIHPTFAEAIKSAVSELPDISEVMI